LLHFEVHTLAEDRWLIDGIFSEKETAIEDAKLLLEHQHAIDAVRVLRVEEKREGFVEATVYIGARPRRRRRKKRGATLWHVSPVVAPPPRPANPSVVPPRNWRLPRACRPGYSLKPCQRCAPSSTRAFASRLARWAGTTTISSIWGKSGWAW
jgi:hypothetical protein